MGYLSVVTDKTKQNKFMSTTMNDKQINCTIKSIYPTLFY